MPRRSAFPKVGMLESARDAHRGRQVIRPDPQGVDPVDRVGPRGYSILADSHRDAYSERLAPYCWVGWLLVSSEFLPS